MKRMLVVLALVAAAMPVAAQPPERTMAAPARARPVTDRDPFSQHFFSPELVMANQSEIGLTEAQRNTVRDEIVKAQATVTELQFRLSLEGERLGKLLASPRVDEAEVLKQVDKVLNHEHVIKRTQLTLLMRIKNTLTPEQQAKLTGLKGREE